MEQDPAGLVEVEAPAFAIPTFDPAVRRTFVGASESASLFGLNPWKSPYELWMTKAGLVDEPDLSANDRVKWGKRNEDAVARGLAEDFGWQVRRVQRVIPHATVANMACTPDYEIVNHPRGPGLLQVKTVDSFTFRQHWPCKEPPINYVLQLQHEMACTGRAWGVLGVLVGGNQGLVFEYERDPATIRDIESAVTGFWASIAAGVSPDPDFQADADLIVQLYRQVTRGEAKSIDDPELEAVIAEMVVLGEAKANFEKKHKVCRARLLAAIGPAEIALCGDWEIRSREVPEVIVPATTRRSYRTLNVLSRVATAAESTEAAKAA
jgi:predicted phage-related endonuclease